MLKVKILFIILSVSFCQITFARSNQTVLPLKFSQGLPSTVVTIQGKQISLLLDIGLGFSDVALFPHALHEIKVNYVNDQHGMHDVTGKKYQHKIFIIPKLQIGSFIVKNVKGISAGKLWGGNEKGFVETEASKSGVIGVKLLKSFSVLFDYPHKQVILTKNGVYPVGYDIKHWQRIPFDWQNNIMIHAKINGIKTLLVLDSGAVPSSIKASSLASRFKKIQCPDSKKTFGKCRAIMAKSFTVVEQTLPKTWFKVNDYQYPFDGLLGSNFFEQNLVYIDFKHNTLFIKEIKQ